MLTKGLKVARAYFNIFESNVNFYFAYFRVLKTNTFAWPIGVTFDSSY